MEKAVDGVGEFVTKNKRPVTFSFSEFKLDELKASMLGLEDGRYATLLAHEFDDNTMLRSLIVGISANMRHIVLNLELQRTAMGVPLNSQFPKLFVRDNFAPLLKEKMEYLQEELQEEALVEVAVEDNSFNVLVQGNIE